MTVPANTNVRNAPQTSDRPPEFDAAVLTYLPALRGLAKRYIPAGKREDVIQEVLEYIFAHWCNFRVQTDSGADADPYGKGSGFYTWLKWCFRGVISNHNSRKRPQLILVDNYKRFHGRVAAQQDDIVTATQVVDRLADRDGVVLLRRAMGDGLKEIGADMGITRERVRQLEVKARERLLKVAA